MTYSRNIEVHIMCEFQELLYDNGEEECKKNPFYDLLYCRGYLISDKKYIVKDNWEIINFFKNLYITFDTRLDCCYTNNDKYFIMILGTAMNTIDWHMSVKKIAEKCLSFLSVKKEMMFDYIDNLCGRHIICYGYAKNQYIIQDATGMRSCYYSKNGILVASHYGIINDIIQDNPQPFMEVFLNLKKSHEFFREQ